MKYYYVLDEGAGEWDEEDGEGISQVGVDLMVSTHKNEWDGEYEPPYSDIAVVLNSTPLVPEGSFCMENTVCYRKKDQHKHIKAMTEQQIHAILVAALDAAGWEREL